MPDYLNELLEQVRYIQEESRLENKNSSPKPLTYQFGLCDEITMTTPKRYQHAVTRSTRT